MWTKAKRLHWSGSARRNDVGAGWECPWGRMSPGAGLWPTPPPLFRPQGHSHPRPTFTVLQRHKAGSFSFPAACDPTPRPPVSQNGQSRFGRRGRSPDLRRRGGFVEHGGFRLALGHQDRKIVVWGKRVSVRVYSGGRVTIKKKNNYIN